MVLCSGNCPVWHCRVESNITLEKRRMKKFVISITDFWLGIILGALLVIIVFSVALGIIYFKEKNKEMKEYAEKQIEVEKLREDYSHRDPDEFLDLPDIRRAADGAAAEFERKRDEALQRFRSRVTN
jgi:di/tricarboxylate transporter